MRNIALSLVIITLSVIATDCIAETFVSVPIRQSERSCAPVAASIDFYHRSYALVIGNTNYTNGWQPNVHANGNIEEVSRALTGSGFETTTLVDLTLDEMDEAFSSFLMSRGDGYARVLLWFSGHGATNDNEGYLVPIDAPSVTDESFPSRAFAMRRLGQLLRAAPAQHIFTMLDACLADTLFSASAALPRPFLNRISTKPARQFLTACGRGEKIQDRHFTQFFLELCSGEYKAVGADNGTAYLAAPYLSMEVAEKVTRATESRQMPRYGDMRDHKFDQGDFAFRVETTYRDSPDCPSEPEANSEDEANWRSVRDSTRIQDFQQYLSLYPRGQFAWYAKRKIRDLTQRMSHSE